MAPKPREISGFRPFATNGMRAAPVSERRTISIVPMRYPDLASTRRTDTSYLSTYCSTTTVSWPDPTTPTASGTGADDTSTGAPGTRAANRISTRRFAARASLLVPSATGSDSPLPSVVTLKPDPKAGPSRAATDSARFTDRSRLYASDPTSSVCPTTATSPSCAASLIRPATSSIRDAASGVSSNTSVANNTSDANATVVSAPSTLAVAVSSNATMKDSNGALLGTSPGATSKSCGRTSSSSTSITGTSVT